MPAIKRVFVQMAHIAAIAAIAAVAELAPGTSVAHATPGDAFDMDKYVAELKQHGWVEGQDYDNENQVIVQGLIDCNGIAQAGSRDAWINSFRSSRLLTPKDVAITTDAAVDAFCPQYKPHG